MLIVYTQAGSEFMGDIGLPSLGGHAAVAILGGQREFYLSWVTMVGAGGLKYELNQFKKAGWSKPVYRVQVPTVEDGGPSQLSVAGALQWWDNGILQEAQAHRTKWNKAAAGPGENPRSVLSGDYNCAEVVRKILIGAGAMNYNPPFDDASTPDTVARLAGFLHRRVGDEISHANGQWPAEAAVSAAFFQHDTLVGRNVIPWPSKKHALAPG